MVELCWVCGGWRILLDLWWFCFWFFYIALNTVKYLEKNHFPCKSFAFENILQRKMFYIETNGA